MIKSIIFDLDDTLIETKKNRIPLLIKLAREEYGLRYTEKDILQEWGKPYYKVLQNLFPTEENWRKVAEKYEKMAEDYPLPAFDGVLETLQILKDKFELAILTSSANIAVRRHLKALELDKGYFFSIQTSDTTDHHKPDPRVFENLLIELDNKNIKKDEIIYIGDWIKDYYASRDANIGFLGVAYNTSNKKIFDKEKVAYIERFSDILIKINT